MKQFTAILQRIWANREVRKKVLFTAAIFFIFRFLAHLPVPAVNIAQLKVIFASSQLLNVLNIFSGGTLANFSVMAVGINPYITASIIMQLAGMVFPALKELQKESEAGREKLNQYTRMLAVPIAVVQSITVLTLLKSQSLLQTNNPLAIITMIFTLVAGSMVLMWLGELVSLYGIGNGISMVLFAGIVGQLPVAFARTISVTTSQQLFQIGIFLGLFLGVIAIMVVSTSLVCCQSSSRFPSCSCPRCSVASCLLRRTSSCTSWARTSRCGSYRPRQFTLLRTLLLCLHLRFSQH